MISSFAFRNRGYKVACSLSVEFLINKTRIFFGHYCFQQEKFKKSVVQTKVRS